MISTIFAGALGILYFRISMETIKVRRAEKISLGHGDHTQLNQLICAHGNFAAYTPLLLITLYFIESSGLLHPGVIAILGSLFTVGRFLHFQAFRGKMNFKLRVRGMKLTLIPLMIQSVMCVGTSLYSTFHRYVL